MAWSPAELVLATFWSCNSPRVQIAQAPEYRLCGAERLPKHFVHTALGWFERADAS
jgi:hypothetical protein